jgi:hypothetical protein
MRHFKIRFTILGTFSLLALGAGACMVDEDLDSAAEEEALDEVALAAADRGEAAPDEAGIADRAPADVGDTSGSADGVPEEIDAKPGPGTAPASLHRGRARVGWPAAGIDICADSGACWVCFYPNAYDKVFHQNHIVYVKDICGDAAWVRDNYGNEGMMRKDALYNW